MSGPTADVSTASGVPWDLDFLRVGALAAAVVTAAAVPLVWLLAGGAEGVGVLLGAAVVTVFFCLSGVVVAWAGRRNDSFTLPAALATFLVKAVTLYGVLTALPERGWLDRRTLAWTVVAGALLWSGVQLRWVWTRKLYYVTPPEPPSGAPVTSLGAPENARPDPESPATRG